MSTADEAALAADIRAVDGAHSIGAGALAEALVGRGWQRSQPVEVTDNAGDVLDATVRYAKSWQAENAEVFGPRLMLELVGMVRDARYADTELRESVEEILDKYNVAGDNEGIEYAMPEDVWRLFGDLRAALNTMKEDNHE